MPGTGHLRGHLEPSGCSLLARLVPAHGLLLPRLLLCSQRSRVCGEPPPAAGAQHPLPQLSRLHHAAAVPGVS